MRCQIISDLHLGHEFYHFKKVTVPEAVAPILIVAGDIWEAGKEFTHHTKWMAQVADRFEHVVFVAGNHDFYSTDIDIMIETYQQLSTTFSNVHYLENSSVTIDGFKFVGATLWTDFMHQGMCRPKDFFRMNDSNQITKGKKLIYPQYILEKHAESVKYLFDNVEVNTVLVTHHPPSYIGQNPKWLAPQFLRDPIDHLFYSDYDEMILKTQPKLIVSGHTHDSYNKFIGSTNLICNPRGYVSAYGIENDLFDWNLVVDLD